MSFKSDSKDSKMSNYSNNILSIQTNTQDIKAYKLRHSTPQDTPGMSNSPTRLQENSFVDDQMMIVNQDNENGMEV